ncbi:MAG: peptidase M23 [Bacteroidota bacterium]
MKISIMALAICTTVFFTSCNSSSEKLQNAKEDVNAANADLSEAQQKYAEEVRLFRIEVGKKITENDKKIDEINAKIKNSKNELKAEYEKQVAILEQNNKDLKIKMGNYKASSKENWESFKSEFNKDMNNLGSALKNFTVEN